MESQGCLKEVTRVIQNVSSKNEGCFMGALKKFHGCFKGIPRKSREFFKEDVKKIQASFNIVPREF